MAVVSRLKGVHPSLALVLSEIAIQIKEQQATANKAAVVAIETWIGIGRLLHEAKAKCPRGTWLEWLEQSVEILPRQAQRYMQAYENQDLIHGMLEGGETIVNMEHTLKAICPPERRRPSKKKPNTSSEDAFESQPESSSVSWGDEESPAQIDDVTEEAGDLEFLIDKGVVEQKEKAEKWTIEEIIDTDLCHHSLPPAVWLETLPLFRLLRGRPLKLFTVDAMFWKLTDDNRSKIASLFRDKHDQAARLCGMSVNDGPFFSDIIGDLETLHPKFWGVCPECQGTGEGDDLICHRCGGYGYSTS